MKVLLVCNIMPPMVAEHLRMESSNKEGWITGVIASILERRDENRNEICLGVAFPMGDREESFHKSLQWKLMVKGSELFCYGFCEDILHPETYDPRLEARISQIIEAFQPDIIHCFGTEYPHTLAVSRIAPKKERVLISIQGLCSIIAMAYRASLPHKVWHGATFRDRWKKDNLIQQQQKFALRGGWEVEAIKKVGNIAGRTEWDRHYIEKWNPKARYFKLNDTLRPIFYESLSSREPEPYSIFISQGDYPIKGLHYMLLALPAILEQFPKTKLYIAGNNPIKDNTVMGRLKLSAYGRYLREIIKSYNLEDRVVFLGNMDQTQMKRRYLESDLFVCCSSIENSPNSLGEAMLLGVPCVSADVGGIPSLFRDKEDGILYAGYRCETAMEDKYSEESSRIVKALADAVIEVWDNPEAKAQYVVNAKKHAKKTHNPDKNYDMLMEIYREISSQ